MFSIIAIIGFSLALLIKIFYYSGSPELEEEFQQRISVVERCIAELQVLSTTEEYSRLKDTITKCRTELVSFQMFVEGNSDFFGERETDALSLMLESFDSYLSGLYYLADILEGVKTGRYSENDTEPIQEKINISLEFFTEALDKIDIIKEEYPDIYQELELDDYYYNLIDIIVYLEGGESEATEEFIKA